MKIIIFKDQKQNNKIIINNFKRFWGFGGKAKITIRMYYIIYVNI
jgi:hypothetical protein